MRCNFLAHFNYANCVYVETNSHSLPAHVWQFSVYVYVCICLTVCVCAVCRCVSYHIMQADRRRNVAAEEMHISSAFPIGSGSGNINVVHSINMAGTILCRQLERWDEQSDNPAIVSNNTSLRTDKVFRKLRNRKEELIIIFFI